MANTPNINLVKPLGTNKALVSDINDNSDKIDAFAGATNTSIAKTQDGYAIVVNGNNAPKAITAGQYLFIKNHSTLSAGGYHATANIANGAAITSSNVAADADGVVNGAFSALNSNKTYTITNLTGMRVTLSNVKSTGKVVNVLVTMNNNTDSSITINGYTTFLSGFPIPISMAGLSFSSSSSVVNGGVTIVNSSGQIQFTSPVSIPIGTYINIYGSYTM